MEWLTERLREKTSWTGLIVVVVAAQLAVDVDFGAAFLGNVQLLAHLLELKKLSATRCSKSRAESGGYFFHFLNWPFFIKTFPPRNSRGIDTSSR